MELIETLATEFKMNILAIVFLVYFITIVSAIFDIVNPAEYPIFGKSGWLIIFSILSIVCIICFTYLIHKINKE